MPSKLRCKIVIDTREQQPWTFSHPTVVRKLDVGDYSLSGYEDEVTIERKSSPNELLTNMGGRDWPRFLRELKTLCTDYEYRCIICEFTLKQLLRTTPVGRLDEFVVMGRLSAITLDLGIPIIFAGNRTRAQETADLFLWRWGLRKVGKTLLDRGL